MDVVILEIGQNGFQILPNDRIKSIDRKLLEAVPGCMMFTQSNKINKTDGKKQQMCPN